MNLFGIGLLWLLLSAAGCGRGEKTVQHVLDLEDVLDRPQENRLDSLFRAHAARTGNQIIVVTQPSFNGRSALEFAVQFGDSLGVGEKGKDNGVVIAFSSVRRAVFIATGRGTERVLHDSTCQRIVDADMLPEFKKGAYFDELFAGSLAVVQHLDQREHRIP